ncbi:MAG TPA: hypothetical protein VLZ11_01740 [Flavobacterium sp.]|nr:hypothetical protein [Flavobacterium sp.]
MKTNIQKYSFFLLGIFLFTVLFQSAHFIKHYEDEQAMHSHQKHQHEHQDTADHCLMCDFTFSPSTGVAFFFLELPLDTLDEVQCIALYSETPFAAEHPFFSLRAPPLV